MYDSLYIYVEYCTFKFLYVIYSYIVTQTFNTITVMVVITKWVNTCDDVLKKIMARSHAGAEICYTSVTSPLGRIPAERVRWTILLSRTPLFVEVLRIILDFEPLGRNRV